MINKDDLISRQQTIDLLNQLVENFKGIQGDMGSSASAAREIVKEVESCLHDMACGITSKEQLGDRYYDLPFIQLIDAAPLYDIINLDLPDTEESLYLKIQSAPTVNAIPVEWIVEWANRVKQTYYNAPDVRDYISWMLRDWERARETELL